MSPKIYYSIFCLLSLFFSSTLLSQKPTDPASHFQIFVEKSLSLTANSSEGGIAAGGDLTINGNFQVAIKSAGSFFVNNVNIGLLVNGKVVYTGSNILQLNNGFLKIGNLENSQVLLTDNNGNYSNEEVCNGSYNSTPRIQLLNKSISLNTSNSNKEVEDSKLIDFGKSMDSMRQSAIVMSNKTNNLVLTDLNGTQLTPNNYTGKLKLTLNAGINYLNILSGDLNNISELNFNNKPDANHVLVVNINAKDLFNWQVWKLNGISTNDCPYILYNFYNTTTLNIIGNNSIEGTLFAPFADVSKKQNQFSVEGQIIAISYEQTAGDLHLADFDADAEQKGCSSLVTPSISGNLLVGKGMFTSLISNITGGIWSSDDTNIATVNNNGLVSGIAKGRTNINYSIANKCTTVKVSAIITVNDSTVVSSGNTGGLESKSLGTIIAKRIYQSAKENMLQSPSYEQLPILKNELIVRRTTGLTSSLNLFDFFPKQLANPQIIPYVTTPTDILSITNAVSVASSDYVLNTSCKAVVFATQTKLDIYDHTKSVCDRLKGATIKGIEKINILGFDLLRFNMGYEDGHQEYIISFSAGTQTGRNSISIQSNWLKQDYTIEENMYNFQVWGVSDEILSEIVIKILGQLATVAPLVQPYQIKDIPKTYINSFYSKNGVNILSINNTATNTSGYFEITTKANELNTNMQTTKIAFNLYSTGITNIPLPASDYFENTIKMFVHDSILDEIFIADGAWNIDYSTQNSTISKYLIDNNPQRKLTDTSEYPLFRDVQLNAVTNSYISVYKLLRGGGVSKDLSGYHTFQFTASGNNPVHITLVKKSIKNWEDQYSIQLPITNSKQVYVVDLNEFISKGSQNIIDPNDITSIVFTMGTITGVNTQIDFSLSNLSFLKETKSELLSYASNSMQVFPNPSNGKFKCIFYAEKSVLANLLVTDIYTGIKLFNKSISIDRGRNEIPVDLSGIYQSNTGGTCIISIVNSDNNYYSKKLIIKTH